MLPWTFKLQLSKRTATQLLVLCTAVFCLVGFFAPQDVAAQQVAVEQGDQFGGQEVDDTLILTGTDIRVVVMRIIRVVLSLLGILALGIILYGGYIIMTSGGAEDKVAEGKKILINGVIGLVIILTSVAIVTFVIRALSNATGSGVFGERVRPNFDSFIGSGALGEIIEDHYPFRNQTGVKRNSRIVVTFTEPIDPSSIIRNTNNTCWGENNAPTQECQPAPDGGVLNPYFGDCIDPGNNDFDYAVHCDQLDTESVQIFELRDQDVAPLPVVAAAAMTTYDANQDAFTFVLRPLEPLGSNTENVRYVVDVRGEHDDQQGVPHPGVLKKEGASAFENDRDGHYFWEFETDTLFDFTPPHVEQVYPREGAADAYRNTIIQITFNEPVDPSVAQGLSGANTAFNNIVFHRAAVEGEWRISNGYRTVEFVPADQCGTNSCGEPMYCLSTGCAVNDAACQEPFTVLVRTAQLLNQNTFEAHPFTGLNDMAGNALDGRDPANQEEVFSHDGAPQGKPAFDDPKRIDAGQMQSDNFWWVFPVRNSIDQRIPYIRDVRPLLDEGGVDGGAPVTVHFSLPMWYRSLTNATITEYPGTLREGDELPEGIEELRPLWTRVLAQAVAEDDERTIMTIDHREFGPNNFDLYYFPSIPSTVKGANQHCAYPGRGPYYDVNDVVGVGENRAAPVCDVQFRDNGDVVQGANCVPVTANAATDTGCLRADQPVANVRTANVDACLARLRQGSLRFFEPAVEE